MLYAKSTNGIQQFIVERVYNMAFWAYQLIDQTGKIIAMDAGYETQEDAKLAAKEKAGNGRYLRIKTFQVWEDL